MRCRRLPHPVAGPCPILSRTRVVPGLPAGKTGPSCRGQLRVVLWKCQNPPGSCSCPWLLGETLDTSQLFALFFVVFAVSPPPPRLFPAQFRHVGKSKSGASTLPGKGAVGPSAVPLSPVPPVPQFPEGFTWRFCPPGLCGCEVLPPDLCGCEVLSPRPLQV